MAFVRAALSGARLASMRACNVRGPSCRESPNLEEPAHPFARGARAVACRQTMSPAGPPPAAGRPGGGFQGP